MNLRARIAALFVVLCGVALNSQAPPQPAPQTPTFRLNVEYVEVDAVVTDGNGEFVRGLTKDDFQIFEDGKPQPISTFSIVDIPVERQQRPLYAAAPIEPDVTTNEQPFGGRVYVMVIDDLHTSFGRTPRVRAAARQFIQQHLGANDLMAVVHTAGPSDASQEFTSNKRLLLAAVDRTFGRKLDSATVTRTEEYFRTQSLGRDTRGSVADPVEAERQATARRSLAALKNVAEWFSTVRGRRKAILFVSEGIDYDITDFQNPGGSLIVDSTRETLAAAARGNVSIYGIDPRGLTTDLGIEVGSFPDDTSLGLGTQSLQREVQLSQASLRELSDNTGGFAVVNRNDFATAFDRIVRDNSSYYAMAYYPPSDKAGQFHRIEVRVTRRDLRVRARQRYMTPKPAASAAKPNANGAGVNGAKLTPEMRDALDSPLPISGLVMKVFAMPFKGTPPNASVLLGVELRGRDLRLNPTDQVSVTYAVVDTDGKVRAGSTDSLAMTLKPETRTRVAAAGLRLLNRLDLPPGRYQVRVAAHDLGGGSVGSVLSDLEVPDFAKLPFSMSGVAVTSARGASEVTVRPDDSLQQVLPGPPVATRAFPQNDQLAIFAEVYDNETARPHKVDITLTVSSDEGKVVVTKDEVRDSSELQGRRGGYGYAAPLALDGLAPGSYVLTVSARSRLGEMRSAERQVQFTVTAPTAPSR